MRIVLASPYFLPDTPPYAAMLDAIARRLERDGHRIIVLTCQPSYNRIAGGRAPTREMVSRNIHVRRRRAFREGRRLGLSRILNVLLFSCSVVAARRWVKRADVVMVVSTPPIILGLSGMVLAKLCRASFVYHKQDIHPDAAAAIGLAQSRLMTAFLRRLDCWTDRRADRVVVLSSDMAATEAERGVPRSRLRIMNNFDPWQLRPTGKQGSDFRATAGLFRVVFAGNLGRFQGLSALIRTAVGLRSDDRIHFDLIGDGALRGELEREVAAQGLGNVTFHGHVPPADVARLLQDSASVGVVSLEPGVVRTAYPSKTMSYLRNGCPVIAMVEGDSELARDLETSGAGVIVPPANDQRLAEVIRQLCGDPSSVEFMQAAAIALHEKGFARADRLDDWAALVRELAPGGG